MANKVAFAQHVQNIGNSDAIFAISNTENFA